MWSRCWIYLTVILKAVLIICFYCFHFLEGSNESQDIMMQGRLMSEEAELRVTVRRDSQVEEQLRHTQEKLQLKEKEVEWRFIRARCSTLTSSFVLQNNAFMSPH